MKFNVSCSWANYGASKSTVVDAGTYGELFQKLVEFFDSSCGFPVVGYFCVIPATFGPYGEDHNNVYNWDDGGIDEDQCLSDVWETVKTDIMEHFGKDVFNENQK